MRADGKSILCPLLLLAGPAVSFVGSPTISPTTVAACVGFLLPSGKGTVPISTYTHAKELAPH